VPLSNPNIVVLVTNSHVKHNLSGSEYPKRVQQCAEAVKAVSSSSSSSSSSSNCKGNLPSLSEAELYG